MTKVESPSDPRPSLTKLFAAGHMGKAANKLGWTRDQTPSNLSSAAPGESYTRPYERGYGPTSLIPDPHQDSAPQKWGWGIYRSSSSPQEKPDTLEEKRIRDQGTWRGWKSDKMQPPAKNQLEPDGLAAPQ